MNLSETMIRPYVYTFERVAPTPPCMERAVLNYDFESFKEVLPKYWGWLFMTLDNGREVLEHMMEEEYPNEWFELISKVWPDLLAEKRYLGWCRASDMRLDKDFESYKDILHHTLGKPEYTCVPMEKDRIMQRTNTDWLAFMEEHNYPEKWFKEASKERNALYEAYHDNDFLAFSSIVANYDITGHLFSKYENSILLNCIPREWFRLLMETESLHLTRNIFSIHTRTILDSFYHKAQ